MEFLPEDDVYIEEEEHWHDEDESGEEDKSDNIASSSNSSQLVDLTKDEDPQTQPSAPSSSTIEAWMMRTADGEYASAVVRPRLFVISRTVNIIAAQTDGVLSEGQVQFKERTLKATLTCGEILKCHGRNISFLGLSHLQDHSVSK